MTNTAAKTAAESAPWIVASGFIAHRLAKGC
jgi:hypothetical protein